MKTRLSMIAIKHILIATDFSETSDAALAYARQLAHMFASTLHVLHVAGNVIEAAVGTEMYAADFVGMQREVEQAAREQLDVVVTDDDRRTLAVRAVVRTSNSPAQEIVAYAKDAKVDLIVLGTHGRGGVAHLFLGSVAERVVRTASCPVLTVRGYVSTSPASRIEEAAVHA
jgi:nucleotide-binding universal stress UspA family protein